MLPNCVVLPVECVQKSEALDRSQRTMLNIALGRVETVGKQLKAGSGHTVTAISS